MLCLDFSTYLTLLGLISLTIPWRILKVFKSSNLYMVSKSHSGLVDSARLLTLNYKVLNMSHNELNRISIHITNLVDLKALILNHNKIKTIDNLASLTNLNTLGKDSVNNEQHPCVLLLTKLS